jgi:probable addiction module antidote protein
MPLKLKEFDPSVYLDNEEVIAEYLTAALEDENPHVFLSAVGHVAKARGMSAIAKSTGLGRESLYKTFAPDAMPRYDTVLKVLHSVGIKFVARGIHAQRAKVVPDDRRHRVRHAPKAA